MNRKDGWHGMKKIETGLDNKGRAIYRLVIRKRSASNPNLRPRVKSRWFYSEAEAIKQEKKLLLLVEKELQKRDQDGIIWGVLVEQWALYLKKANDEVRGLTTPTAENYVQTLRDYTADWNKLPVNAINQADVRDLYQKLWGTNSRSLQEKVRTAINAVIKWAILSRKVKGVHHSPTAGVSMVGRKEEKMPEILTILDIRKLLEMARELNHFWYYTWAVALYTGMRNGELHALEWGSVNFHDKELYVHKAYNTKTRKTGPTKGTYWRTVPVSDELDRLLKEIKLSSGNSELVLPRTKDWDRGSQAKILRTFCQSIGVPSVKFHTLRACFATQLIRDGIAPGVVMSICGWKDLETMQIYIRRSGIEVKGATDNLRLISQREAMGRVVQLFKK